MLFKTLTQFTYDLLYADLAPVHKVSESIKTLAKRLLRLLQPGVRTSIPELQRFNGFPQSLQPW